MELIDNLRDYITRLNDKHLDVTKENLSLKDEINKLNDRLENISNVSIIKNLNTQIYEKDQIIQQLEKKLNGIITKNNDLSSKIETLMKEPIKLTIEEEPLQQEEEEVVEHEEPVEEEEADQVEEVEEDQVEEEEEDQVEYEHEEPVEEEVPEDEEVVEEEISFIEKKLKPPNSKGRKLKTYLITDDEYKDIYERLEDGEPGEHVGKLTGKQNKPVFFSN